MENLHILRFIHPHNLCSWIKYSSQAQINKDILTYPKKKKKIVIYSGLENGIFRKKEKNVCQVNIESLWTRNS